MELSYTTDREGDVDRVGREELLDGRDRLGLGAPRVELGADLGGELPGDAIQSCHWNNYEFMALNLKLP